VAQRSNAFLEDDTKPKSTGWPALLVLVRLLARQAAREALHENQFHPMKELAGTRSATPAKKSVRNG